MNRKGMVFRFQRHALHDGPGIRTLVFLKGCPLRCLWCFNPESQKPGPELLHRPDRCLGCDRCVEACPISGALIVGPEGRTIDRRLCNGCGQCAEVCPTGAMSQVGEFLEPGEVFDQIEKDRIFYDKSGGGVTLSGGEVTLQSDFACEILRQCQEAGIHTAIETCGHTCWENMERILAHTDLVLYDLKVVDAQKHLAFTGVRNDAILDNAQRVVHSGIPTIIRLPVIPGYTDGESDLEDAARFIADRLPDVLGVHLLPYETLGVRKYQELGRRYALARVQPPSEEHLLRIKALFERFDLKVQIGG